MTDTEVQIEILINECRKAGTDVDRDQALKEFDILVNDHNVNTDEALRAVEENITERNNLPETIKYGPVSFSDDIDSELVFGGESNLKPSNQSPSRVKTTQ